MNDYYMKHCRRVTRREESNCYISKDVYLGIRSRYLRPTYKFIYDGDQEAEDH